MPWLTKVAADYEPKGVAFIAASRDEPDEQVVAVALFVDGMPALKPYAYFAQPEDADRFGVEALPTLFVLDRTGRVVAHQAGQTNEAAVRRWLDQALERR